MFTAAVADRYPDPIQSRRRRKRSGFTIFEVAVATAVMTMAIGSALLVLGRGFDSMDTTRCLSYASQILQSEMERTRLTSWGDGTTVGTGTSGLTSLPAGPAQIQIDSIFYNAGDVGSRMTLTRTLTDVHAGMIQVTFSVSWTTHDGHPMSRSYTTYYGKNGLYDYFSS